MRKSVKIAIFLLLAAAVGAAGLEYLNRKVLPVKTRQWTQTLASEALGRKVSVERVRLHPWHGFLLEQVVIAEETAFGEISFLEVERLSGGILLLPLLKERKLIIPTLHIVRPKGRFLQGPKGNWNIQTLRRKQKSQADKPGKFQLLIPKIVISKGTFDLVFGGANAPDPLQFEEVNAQLTLSLPAKARWDLSAQLKHEPQLPLALTGSYSVKEKLLKLEGKSDVPLSFVLRYLPKKIRPKIHSLQGHAQMTLKVAGKPKEKLSFEGIVTTDTLDLGLKHPIASGWQADPPETLHLRGGLRIDAKADDLSFPISFRKVWKRLATLITLDETTLDPLPRIGRFEKLSGKIGLTAEEIKSQTLSASLPSGAPVTLTAALDNSGQRTFSLSAKTALPVGTVVGYFPQAEQWAQKAKPGGQAAIDWSGSGILRPKPSMHSVATVIFTDLAFQIAENHRFESGAGQARWQPDLVTVSDLKGRLSGRPLQLEGTLVQSDKPQVDAQIRWGELTAETQLTLHPDRLEIHGLNGKSAKNLFRLLGEIKRPADTEAEAAPVGNLYGEWAGPIEELISFWPKPPGWLEKAALQGEASGRWFLQGDLRNPKRWECDLKVNSPALTAWGITFKDAAFQIGQEEGRVIIPLAKGLLAGGTVEASGVLNPRKPENPWQGKFAAAQVELAELIQTFKWETQMAGKLSLEWEGTGSGADLTRITGKGMTSIHGAQILELPFLGPLASLLKVPNLRTLVFQQAGGSFALQGGQIRTDGLELKAPQAALTISGSGGFLQGANSPIDWTIIPALEPELLEENQSKLGEVIARGTELLAGEIQVTGTWKNPKRSYRPQQLKDVINKQLKNLPELLEELF